MNLTNRKLLVVFAFMFLLATILGGWFVFRDKKTPEGSQSKPVIGENTTQKPEDTKPSSVDTSDWKTYRNEEYGFELRYPEGYDVSENNQWPRFFQVWFSDVNSTISFQVEVISKKYEGDKSFNFYLDHLVSSKSSLSGKEANLFILEKGYCDGPGCSPPIVALKVDLGNRFLVLDFTGARSISEDFPQIVVKSFRFID